MNKSFLSSNYCMNIVLSKKFKNRRTKIIRALNNVGIGTSIYYPKPVPLMSFYKDKYKYNSNNFKNASLISNYSISLPTGPHLKIKDLNFIVKELKKLLK